jgi:glucosamine--fructose-6-phosphate aminotransferase (isomerizing)
MCGIYVYLKYLTDRTLKEILTRLLKGLRKLEYRSYDSCGICFDTQTEQGRRTIVAKTPGAIVNLEAILGSYLSENIHFTDQVAIGHTQWETHRPPTSGNAHSHFSSTNFEFIVVHNGIVSNYAELKRRMLQESTFSLDKDRKYENLIQQSDDENSIFPTDTDSEVFVELAIFVYNQLRKKSGSKPSFLTVIAHTLKLVEGTFGCLFKSTLYPNEVVACRLSSPILIDLKSSSESEADPIARSIELKPDDEFLEYSEDLSDPALVRSAPRPCELFIVSDAPAFDEETNRTVILDDWDLVHITSNGVDIINTAPKAASFPPSRMVETLNVSIQDIFSEISQSTAQIIFYREAVMSE